VLGGLVVAAVGLLALNAGWIEVESDSESPATVPAISRTTPAAENGEGLSIGEIYARHAAGVTFIKATRQAEESLSPFGLPERRQGTATGSGFVVDADGHILTNHHVVAGA